jgi:hypothetical protein
MKEKENLTKKIFKIELLSGAIFYGIGLLLITPSTDPAFIKYIAIGGMFVIEISILIYALIIRSEKIDERAKKNFNKSSTTTLSIIFVLLTIFGLTIQIFSLKITFSFGLISLMLATTLAIHATAFKKLEVSGE